MELTEKQEKKFQRRLKNYYNIESCLVCKNNDFNITCTSVGHKEDDMNIPLIVLTCLECGYTMFFNAKIQGFVE